MSYSYHSRNPLAAANPLRSMVWNKPAAQVLGPSPRQLAEFNLAKCRSAVQHLSECLAEAYRNLGEQNRRKNKILRKISVAAAFRTINRIRTQLRAAHRDSASAGLAMLPFAAAA
ncbi:MAG: hypothetical protein P4L66_08090 [Acetobacteraceae bacterium]|nr:hypothetical protein [Acetobacteraceae bacterium]